MGRNASLHSVNGKMITLKEASKKYNISLETIKGRVRRGKSLQEAVDTGPSKEISIKSNKGNEEWQSLGKN